MEVDGSFSDDFFDDTMQSESIDIDVFSTYDEDVDIKWREDEYSDDYTVIASIEAHGSTGLNTVCVTSTHLPLLSLLTLLTLLPRASSPLSLD